MQGATFSGAIDVADAGLRGMITLRCDLAKAGLAEALDRLLGLAVPGRRTILCGEKGAVAWMSPDELLIMVDYAKTPEMVGKLEEQLAGLHVLVVNVSDARAVFTLHGKGWRDVLAKGTPADMSIAAFDMGEIRRSRLGQVAAAFWMTGPDSVDLVCFRSHGAYTFEWLKNAAHSGSLPEFFV